MNLHDLFVFKKLGDSGGGGGEAVLVAKIVNQNGYYLPASDNADGYSSVTVAIPDGDSTEY